MFITKFLIIIFLVQETKDPVCPILYAFNEFLRSTLFTTGIDNDSPFSDTSPQKFLCKYQLCLQFV